MKKSPKEAFSAFSQGFLSGSRKPPAFLRIFFFQSFHRFLLFTVFFRLPNLLSIRI